MSTTVVDLLARLSADTTSFTKNIRQAGTTVQTLKSQTTNATVGMQNSLNQTSGAASKFATSVGNQFGQLTQKLSSFAMGAATATSAAIAGFAIPTLFKGFQRMTSIQDSTVALGTALQDTTKAAWLLDEVLKVVKGTPFNFDQFAAAAQQMVGMGVQAELIPGYLRAIGEASATQGGRANEFAQRLATIFGQVSAQGRIMGDDIMQISQTGVNALAILGNHFGITSGEMREMISKGAVPARVALDALSNGILNGSNGVNGATIAFTGTMEGLRKTLTGAIGGVKSAQARLGAAFLTPFSGAFTEAANVATAVIDKLTPVVKNFAEMIVANPGFKMFQEWLSKIPEKIPSILTGLNEMKSIIGPLLGLMVSMAGKNIGDAFGPLGALVPRIGPLAGLFIGLAATSEPLRQSFMQLAESVLPLVKSLSAAFAPVLDQVGQMIIGLIPVINTLMPSIESLVNAFIPLIPIFAALAFGLIPTLVEILTILINTGIVTLIGAIVPLAESLGTALLPIMVAVGDAIATVLGPAMIALVPAIVELVNALIPLIPIFADLAVDLLPIFANMLVAVLPVGITLLKDAIVPLVSFLTELVAKVVELIPEGDSLKFTIESLTVAFVAYKAVMNITDVVGRASSAMTKMKTSADTLRLKMMYLNSTIAANPIVAIIIGLIALGVIVYLAYKRFEGFRKVVDAAWQGIQAAFHAAWDVISEVFSKIWSWIMTNLVPVFVSLWNTIQSVWNSISKTVMNVWNTVFKIVFTAIKVYLTVLFTYFKIWWTVVSTTFKVIATIMTKLIFPLFQILGIIVFKVVSAIVGYVINLLMPVFNLLWEGVQVIFNAIGAVITFVWENVIQPIFNAIAYIIANVVIPYYMFLWQVVSFVFGAVAGAIGAAWDFMSGIFRSIIGGIGALAGFIGDRIGEIVDFFTGIGGRIQKATSGMWDGLRDSFKAAINWIIKAWNNFRIAIPEKEYFGVKIGGFSIDTPDVPLLHQGGMVTGFGGKDVPAILQPGELVLSRKAVAAIRGGDSSIFGSGAPSQSSANVTVTINMPPGSNGTDVVNAIKKYERLNGPVFARA